MSEILDLRHTLAPSGQAHYVSNDLIEACDPPGDIQSAAIVMVSERHSKFALTAMTEYLLSEKAALTARVAELEKRQGDQLHAFLDAAAGEGYILGGVDAAELYVSVFPERYAAAVLAKEPGCGCQTCRPITLTDMRMVVCAKCGNKRCPHATNHLNACTGSNEPGQPGSAYQ